MNNRILNIIILVISVIGLFFMVRIMMEGSDVVKESAELQASIVDPFITFANVVLIITAVITVIWSIINLFKNPKTLKTTLIGVAVFVVLFLIAYFTASDAIPLDVFGDPMVLKDMNSKVLSPEEAASTMKNVTALINFTGILGAIGIGLVGWGFINSLVKK
ncbi:hypothetical protein MWU59_12995 [Flavobacteriaceae bacterium F08102]|nr:hypothetical protein [Flavobacteriaceae bacterium F08102]